MSTTIRLSRACVDVASAIGAGVNLAVAENLQDCRNHMPIWEVPIEG